MKFFPVSNGKVVMFNYLGSNCNGVLIQHDQKVDGLWIYSSYLHGKDLTVKKVGDRVSVNSSLGRVWNNGPQGTNYHLHVGVYAATDIKAVSGQTYAYTAQLEKRDATFGKRNVIINASPITIKKGATIKSDAYAISDTSYSLSDASLSANTLWQSSDKSIATVDRNRNIKGVAGGKTSVTVYFSGEKHSIPVTVTEPDTTKPAVLSFSVSSDSIKKGSSVTISYKVSDSGGSGLKQAELWRGNSKSNLTHIKTDSLSGTGNGPKSGQFKDTPSSTGTYYYGIHVVDNAGNVGYDNGAKPVVVK